jgi:hypothetical protein
MNEKDEIIARLTAENVELKKGMKAREAGDPDINDTEDDDEGMKAGAEPVSTTERNTGRTDLEPVGVLAGKHHRGSARGVTFRDGGEHVEAAQGDKARARATAQPPKTVAEAMSRLQAEGWKPSDAAAKANRSGWELRAAARRKWPHLDDRAG